MSDYEMSERQEMRQEMLVAKLKKLGRAAPLSELAEGEKGHPQTHYASLLKLIKVGIVRREGMGSKTAYALATSNGNGVAHKSNGAPVKRRWVLLVDGEALIVEATEVQVYPERTESLGANR